MRFARWVKVTTVALLVGTCLAASSRRKSVPRLPDGAAVTPQGPGPTPDEQIAEDEIDRIILDAGEADPDVRHLAQQRVRNLPARAYEKVKAELESGAISPEIKITLDASVKALAVRHTKYQRETRDLKWQKDSALEAYEQAGTHSPAWDAAARAALSRLGDVPLANPVDDDAAKFAAFGKAIDAGCKDPLIVTLYTYYQLEMKGPAPVVDGVAKPPAHEAPSNSRDWILIKSAADDIGATRYSARFKCLAFQSAARLNLRIHWIKSADTKRFIDLGRAVLGDAVRTPGISVERQLEIVLAQYHLEILADPKASLETIVQGLYPIYAAAAPGTAGPLLFKATEQIDAARVARGDPNQWPSEKDRKHCLTHLSNAEKALESAWKLDPSDSRVAVDMIGVRSGLDSNAADMQSNREQLDKWFGRAMDADPDNYAACAQKLQYLMEFWEEGEEPILEFAGQCAKTENFRGRIGLIAVQTHLEIARRLGNPTSYFRLPRVWQDVQSSYETCLKIFPDAAYDRSMYAKLAEIAGRYDLASEQLSILGDKAVPSVFGGQLQLDALRLTAAAKAQALARGGAAAATRDIDPLLAKALEDASVIADVNDKMGQLFFPVAARFPKLNVTNEKGNLQWQTVTLNKAGQSMDCLRLHTPPQPRDFRMAAIVSTKRYARWSVLDLEKKQFLPLIDLPEFLPLPVTYYRDVPVPHDGGGHTILLRFIPADWLKPDSDYLLWFRYHDPNPIEMSIAITFVNPAKNGISGREMVKELGLKPAGNAK